MRFVIINDIHFGLSQKEIEFLEKDRPDAYLFLGDVFPEFKKYFYLLKNVPKFGVQGNHDCLPGFADVYEKYGIHLLDKAPVYIPGTQRNYFLAGISETKMRYHGMDRISEQEIEENAEEKLKCMRAITDLPEYTTRILLSHDSGLGDIEKGAGFKALSDCRRNLGPNLHIFGHYHCSHRFHEDYTECICVYRISVLEIDARGNSLFWQVSEALEKPSIHAENKTRRKRFWKRLAETN